MIVGIWGSYREGNFGDDLMAIVFASIISEIGHKPLAFRLPAQLATSHGFESVALIEELIARSDRIVIGGGGFLTKPNWLAAFRSTYVLRGELDAYALARGVEKHGIDLLPLSIGSDGNNTFHQIGAGRRRLFRSSRCVNATVRLRSDVALMKECDVDATYFPDILFALPKFCSIGSHGRNASGKKVVGINLSARRGAAAINALQRHFSQRADIVLRFYNSHTADSGHKYEYVPQAVSETIKFEPYVDPAQLTYSLQGLDCVISSKLHIGVAALSIGVPFISFGGKGKTRAQMSEIGLSDYIFADDQTTSLLASLDTLLERPESYDFSGAVSAAADAIGHRDYLLESLSMNRM